MGIAIERRAKSAPDGYLDSIAKLVPGDVLAAFLAALHIPGVRDVQLAVLAGFAILVPAALRRSARRAGGPAHWLQYAVRTAAFLLVAAGAGLMPLAALDGLHWIPAIGAVVVVLFAAAILTPPAPRDPPVP